MHGLLRPLKILLDVAGEMQLLGNAISTLHAAAALEQGLHYVGFATGPTMAEAVQLVCASRVHAANSVLLPFATARIFFRSLRFTPPRRLKLSLPEQRTQQCILGEPPSQVTVQIAQCLPVWSTLQHLGLGSEHELEVSCALPSLARSFFWGVLSGLIAVRELAALPCLPALLLPRDTSPFLVPSSPHTMEFAVFHPAGHSIQADVRQSWASSRTLIAPTHSQTLLLQRFKAFAWCHRITAMLGIPCFTQLVSVDIPPAPATAHGMAHDRTPWR